MAFNFRETIWKKKPAVFRITPKFNLHESVFINIKTKTHCWNLFLIVFHNCFGCCNTLLTLLRKVRSQKTFHTSKKKVLSWNRRDKHWYFLLIFWKKYLIDKIQNLFIKSISLKIIVKYQLLKINPLVQFYWFLISSAVLYQLYQNNIYWQILFIAHPGILYKAWIPSILSSNVNTPSVFFCNDS